MADVNEDIPGIVRPPAVLSLGVPGTGKTFALATLAAHEYIEKLIYLFTDPGGEESLIDGFRHYGVPVNKLHYAYIPPASHGWDALIGMAEKVNTMTYESLGGLKAGIDKQEHRQIFDVLDRLSNFKCDRTGQVLGPADEWPDNWAFAFDSVTGLNTMCREATVGAKPTLHQGEWGTAMVMEEIFFRKLTSGIPCPRVMVAHLALSRDEVSGRNLLYLDVLGNKLAPKIPHMFSDIVLSKRAQKKFLWSTDEDNVALKTRNLPLGDAMDPDYGPLIDKWLDRKEFAKGNIEGDEE